MALTGVVAYPPAAGQAVEAPWGKEVAHSVVQKFATAAERSTKWVSPPTGAVSTTINDGKLFLYLATAVGGAPAGWNEVALKTRDVSIMMPKSGGTFTNDVIFDPAATAIHYGPVIFRRSGDAPYIEFQANAATGSPAANARFGYLQTTATYMLFVLNNAAGYFSFRNSGANTAGNPPREMLRIADNGVFVYGGSASVPGVYSLAPIQVGGDGPQLRVVDTNTATGTSDAYIGFYAKGTVTAPGSLGGWVGYNGSVHLYLRNAVAGGQVIVQAQGTNSNVQLNATNDITFYASGVFQGLMTAGDFLWGKSASDSNNAGIEMMGIGSAGEGEIYSTTTSAGRSNLNLKHVGNAHADKQLFVKFWSSGTYLSYIAADTVSPLGVHGVNFLATAPSDYRMKDDLGPVIDPVARVLALKPKHLRWKESGKEFDGFIAHEVAEVAPYAVHGEKDAVYDAVEAETMGVEPETIKAQQLDAPALLPLVVATLQDVLTRLEALEEEAAA